MYNKSNVLHIYLDESGNFGLNKDGGSKFYVVTFIYSTRIDYFKEKNILFKQISRIDDSVECIHSSPLIRQKDEYLLIPLNKRRYIFNSFIAFIKKININYSVVVLDKKGYFYEDKLYFALKERLKIFLNNNLNFLNRYKKIVIHYDNGQNKLGRLVKETFKSFFKEIEFNYKEEMKTQILIQVADTISSLYSLLIKFNNSKTTYKELEFFESKRKFKKNYIEQISKFCIK